jgi:hypothetical protein
MIAQNGNLRELTFYRDKRSNEYELDSLESPSVVQTTKSGSQCSFTTGVAMDGLHYDHETLELDISVGKQYTHSCGYRLLFTDEYLGEITFKRNRRFSEREMQLIKSLIPALIKPLRESLKSQHTVEL